MRSKVICSRIAVWILTVAIVVFCLFPILWMVMISFKAPNDALVMPPELVFTPTLKNYREVLFGIRPEDKVGRAVPTTNGFPKQMVNSIVVCGFSTLFSLLAGVPASFALAKFKFKRRQSMSTFILSTRFVPPIVIVIPIYLAFQKLGLMDTLLGLIILYTFVNLSLVIWMMKGFFDELPTEILESARIDGCSHYGTLLWIGIPITKHGIAASAILSMIYSWNEFLFATLFTAKHAKTIPLMAMGFVTVRDVSWTNMAACAVLMTLPVLFFTLLTQKNLVRGLTAGAIKG